MNAKKIIAYMMVFSLSFLTILTAFSVTKVVTGKFNNEDTSFSNIELVMNEPKLKNDLQIYFQDTIDWKFSEGVYEGEMVFVDTAESIDWGVDETDADLVWGITDHSVDIDSNHIATGDGVNVAVIDVSFDTDHVDLANNYVGGWNFIDNNYDTSGSNTHGTHCAGIIAAEDNDVDDSVIGVSPEANIYGLKVELSANPNDPDEVKIVYSDIYEAINWSINNDMDVISMSISIPYLEPSENYIDTTDLETIINTTWNSGIVLVTSAGNDNSLISSSTLAYPQKFYNMITVGAINNNDERWIDSSNVGSNYGPELDLVAPGVNIRSCITDNPNLPNDPLWAEHNGTSGAAPMVAGTCALILEVQPTLTADQIREILFMTAEDLGSTTHFGHGKINASRAVDAAQLYFNDTDNDGLTDAEEKYKYFTDLNDTDSDNDGLGDGDEVSIYETDPADNDSDNDSCEDGWEIYYGYNPNLLSDGALDQDNDDMRNMDEHFVGTHPNCSDTDGDYILDGDEVFWNLDPLDDSDADDDDDNDGLTNIEEINGWYDLNDDGDYEDTDEKSVFKTKPNDSDTDGDGWNDYREQYPLMGDPTDPTDPTDKPPFFP